MRWCRATFSYYCACFVLLSSARADRRHRDAARSRALNPEDNGAYSARDERVTAGQRSSGLDQSDRCEHLDPSAGSTSLLSQWNEEVAVCSAVSEGPWGHSLYALIDRLRETVLWGNQKREPRHTLPQIRSAVKSIAPGILFHKCAKVVTGSEFPQVNVSLVVTNFEDGLELSKLSIRDTISDLISLQSNGTVQSKEYQTFSKDTLHAGSRLVESYTASVKGSTNEDLFLPAFLTFSSISQNDISLFRPVVANFTLRINTTEKVCARHGLHFAGFCVAFLISTLLLSFSLLTVSCFYKKFSVHTPRHRERQSFSVEAEPEEAVCNTSDTANEDAAFEDRIVEIMALEDPQDMLHSVDNLETSCLLRGGVMVECTRVQMLKGVFRVLTANVGDTTNEVSMVDVLSHVTEIQEDEKSQLNAHTAGEAHTERQDADHRRSEALRRREELHGIIYEEIEEAAMTGGTHLASQLLHRYYTSQDQLELVLDLFVANQRAALSEQHAQRRFLLQGLQDLQSSMCDMFSVFCRHIDAWFARIRREGILSDQHCVQQLERAQSELQRVQKRFEETLVRERNSAYCDIIKTRRARIAETLCEQKHEQQDLVCGSGCVGPLEDYLTRWQSLLCAHNTHLSELIAHLDQEAAAHIRRVLVCVLRDAVADLKQVECETSESLQDAGVPRWLLLQMRAGSVVGGCLADTEAELAVRKREAAKTLRQTRSTIQQIREQELKQQKERRERILTFCRSLWESQCSLSESDLLRLQLEYVKSACRLDRCLVLPLFHTRENGCNTPTTRNKPAPDQESTDSCHVSTNTQVCVCKREECEEETSACEDRLAMQVAAVQWDKAERKNRVLETHAATLALQTVLMQTVSCAPAEEELSHAIHTHSLALEEAELLLKKEESEWERSMDGHGHNNLLDPDEANTFRVNTELTIAECLQEALCKRQQLTHTLITRLRMEIRRQQMMEDLREQQELKRLYTHFDQDLLLAALLVKISGVSEPLLQQLLCLLLPTQTEEELQSLIHTLAPKEGRISGTCRHLVDRLRNDVIGKHKSPGSYTYSDRMLKKKQKLVEKLFSGSHADNIGHDPQAVTAPPTQKEEAASTVAGESAACAAHAGEADVVAGSEMSGERLFTVRCAPRENLEHTHTGPSTHTTQTPRSDGASESLGKKKKFRLKKGAVAPLEQT